jgi:hypothetical protein
MGRLFDSTRGGFSLNTYSGMQKLKLDNITQLYRCGQFYWWRKLEYAEKTTDLPQIDRK